LPPTLVRFHPCCLPEALLAAAAMAMASLGLHLLLVASPSSSVGIQ
jgi:hypothetical protein